MTRGPEGCAGERADAARNRARLVEAAARLVAEHGADHVTMHEVAQAAGVGKGTLFRRFGDRTGLLLALMGDAEAEFREAYTSGPPPLGPGAPATDRLTSFGFALIERITDEGDLGAALARQVPLERRHSSQPGRSFQQHIASLLREAGVEADHEVIGHAMLVFTNFETIDHLRNECGISTTRLRSTWADLVRLVTGGDGQGRRRVPRS